MNFRTKGHTWGTIHNVLEVPLFVDSRASRLVQLADLIAYAMFRYYEKQNSEFFDQIVRRFDANGGVLHGLVHYTPDGDHSCMCPACKQRRQQVNRE